MEIVNDLLPQKYKCQSSAHLKAKVVHNEWSHIDQCLESPNVTKSYSNYILFTSEEDC